MSADTIPITTKHWSFAGQSGVDSLIYIEAPVPVLRDNEVLVQLRGASLNFRDILIPQGKYPWTVKPDVVLGSDGAGFVLAIGKSVTRFKPGDKVITMLNQQHVSGPANESILEFGTGASIDGTFRSVGAFDEQGLVAMPHTLNFIEAATLTCAGITAWNALFGLTGNRLMPGQWVLTQGTGGVSIFALQFAKATGARVIATTSSPDKVELLKGLGADYVINYRQTPNWGSVAKGLTGGSGIDIVVDVAGATTLKQSADSVKVEGLICVVGIVGGDGEAGEIPTLLDAWKSSYTVRGILVGSRMQMEEMCRAIDGNPTLRPFVDPHTFKLDQLKEAYEYLSSGNNQGKVGIDIL